MIKRVADSQKLFVIWYQNHKNNFKVSSTLLKSPLEEKLGYLIEKRVKSTNHSTKAIIESYVDCAMLRGDFIASPYISIG